MTGVEQADWGEHEFAAALKRLRHHSVIDGAGRHISSLQVARIMDAAVRSPDERRVFKRATFDGATFHGRADFGEAIFEGDADFDKATFKGEAHFEKATFDGEAHFEKATFDGDAHFPEATFMTVDFSEATFQHAAHFPGVTVDGNARFREASLKEVFVIGPMLVRGALVLDGASFGGIEIRASVDRLLCQRTQFHGPANLRIRWAEVVLDGAVFESASLLGSSEAFVALLKREADPAHPLLNRLTDADELEQEWRKRCASLGRKAEPRLVSLRGANVGNLVVSGVDLGTCLFAGTANLDGLRIEGSETFPTAPGWKEQKGSRLVARRLSPRRTVADEHHWRAQHCYGPGWQACKAKAPGSCEESSPPQLEEIAGIYRALRKGREDTKDEPGAADFYYGEMEMRRHAAKARRRILPGIEEAVLWLYWLVSGYGLRASRALAALAITVVVGAVLLDQIGFDDDQRPEAGALLYAVESSISLLRAPNTDILTDSGNVVQIALRLAGPLFFALALLSLRGRVKR